MLGAAAAYPGAILLCTGAVLYTVEIFHPAPYTPATYRYDPGRVAYKRKRALIGCIAGAAIATAYGIDAIARRRLDEQGPAFGVSFGLSLFILEGLWYRHLGHKLNPQGYTSLYLNGNQVGIAYNF